MFFRKQGIRIKKIQNMPMIIFLPVIIVIIITATACSAPKGSIVILENPNGTGFTMDFTGWSSKNKCELALNKGDELQIEVVREKGEVALVVSGKNGSEPYRGNILKSIVFTLTVSETDKYDFQITGKNASGKLTVKKVGSR